MLSQHNSKEQQELLESILAKSKAYSLRNIISKLKSEEEMATEIATQTVTIIQTTLIAILNDLIAATANYKNETADSARIIECCSQLRTYILNMYLIETKNVLSRAKHTDHLLQTRTKLRELLENFSHINQLNFSVLCVWKELSAWLQGYYLAIANQVPAPERTLCEHNNSSHYVTGFFDRVLKYYTGITQIDIVVELHRLAAMLRLQIKSENMLARQGLFATTIVMQQLPEYEALNCVVKFSPMNKSMFCTLDCVTYDDKEIREYLQNKKQTFSRVALPENKKVNEVLIDNIIMQNIIDLYKRQEAFNVLLNCPITKKPFEHPAICTLDGMTYEANNIRDYLMKHRKTPGGVVMKKNDKVEEIVLPNRAVVVLMDEMKLQADRRATV